MNQDENYKALIYCRVSSERQVKEGNGLGSQEKRCRDYAKLREYPVIKVFSDEGVSGGKYDRPGMLQLLKFIDDNPLDNFVVIFDDLSRLARSTQVHIQLKTALTIRKVKLECLNFTFDDTEEGEFAELVLASAHQLSRKQNRRQVIQKQKARLENGYWCFCQPTGYRFISDSIHKKILAPDKPISEIIKATLESYDSGYLNTLENTKEFIQTEYEKRGIDKKISINGAERILKNILYAGYIEYQPWKVERRKGHHEPLITLEMYERIQKKLESNSKGKKRKDYSEDFPLRGFLVCSDCGTRLTASWAKGRSARYPNYWCKSKECEFRYKTISKYKLEPEFETLLSGAKLSPAVLEVIEEVFHDVWENKYKQYGTFINNLERAEHDLDTRISNLVERVSSAKSQVLIETYENELEKLTQERTALQLERNDKTFDEKTFGTALDKVSTILKNPLVMWNSDVLDEKRIVVQMYFDNEIVYDYNLGFGTGTFTHEINTLKALDDDKNHLVEMAGIEPAS